MIAATAKRTLPLEAGDRLTRNEFERRYFAMPEVKKAELIEGEVYMGSPVDVSYHAMPHADLQGWLFNYRIVTPGAGLADNGSFRFDKKNELQPDMALFIQPEFGGRISLGKRSIMDGAPELVAEISGSSASIDRNRKLKVYRRNGVQEYIVWRTYDAALDWFTLQNGEYVPLQADKSDGLLKSAAFPGLWLDSVSLLRRDMPAVLAALNRGTASPEHAAFVQKLASQRTS
jgi:Uma2 family endonuclease